MPAVEASPQVRLDGSANPRTAHVKSWWVALLVIPLVLIAGPVVLFGGFIGLRDLIPSGPTAISPVGRHLVGAWTRTGERLNLASDHTFSGAGALPGAPGPTAPAGCRPQRQFNGTWHIDASLQAVELDYAAPCSFSTGNAIQVERLATGKLALFYFMGDPDDGNVVTLVNR